MAAAVKSKAYGLKRKRGKSVKTSYKNLRAAKRQGVVPEFIPNEDTRTATAVAQLATPGVAAARPSTDELSIIRVSKAAVLPTAPEDPPEEPPIPKEEAEAKAPPKVEEKKPEPPPAPKATEEKVAKKKGVSKRLLKKQQQAEKRAEAEDRKRAQREEAKRVKEEQAKARAVKPKPEPAKPKPKASKRKRKQQVDPRAKRQLRIQELRAKYECPSLEWELTDEEALDTAIIAVETGRFDLSEYLKRLLAGDPKQARAYLNTVTSYSEPVKRALISLHSDEIRNALHAGLQPAEETWHSSETLVPRFKLKDEDPRSKMSDTWAIHHEGGMHLYEFSHKVYVTVTVDGKVVEEGTYVQVVEEYRTQAYIRWLERNYYPKRHVELNAFDFKTGEVLNDFYLQAEYEPSPVMVGNLQVGTRFVKAERVVPLSWEVARFKHELRDAGSQDSRANRGKDRIQGLVGVSYLEGLMKADEDNPKLLAANDDTTPWEAEDNVAFVPLPNPKLNDAEPEEVKRNPKILTKATLARTVRPNPEFQWRKHLDLLPGKRAAKWQALTPLQLHRMFRESMYGEDPEPGLRTAEGYRWDPGLPEPVKTRAVEERWPSNVVELHPKQAIVEPVTHDPKQPDVGAVTHKPLRKFKGSVLSILASKEAQIQERIDVRGTAHARLLTKCPPLPEGQRSMRMCRATIKDLTDTTRIGWRSRWAAEIKGRCEEQRLHNWLKGKENDVPNLSVTEYDAVRYVAWMEQAERREHRWSVTESQFQEHLSSMEDRWPSLTRPEECKVCLRTLEARYKVWAEAKREAELKESCMVTGPMGNRTLDLSKFNELKKKAAQPKAKTPAVKAAKIREPVVRASNPEKLNHGVTGGGQSSFALQSFTPAEIDAMKESIENKAVEILVWSSLKGLVPQDKIQGVINRFINPGKLILRPT